MFILNQIGGFIAERAYSVTEQLWLVQPFINALNWSYINRYETNRTGHIVNCYKRFYCTQSK